eukprot:4507473-Prymnesium_polylepis.1
MEWIHQQPSMRSDWQFFQINDDNAEYPPDSGRHWAYHSCGDAAIETGDIDIFKWVCARDPGENSWMRERAMSAAACSGKVDMLKYLLDVKKCRWQMAVTDDGEHLQTLKFVMNAPDLSQDETLVMMKECHSLGAQLSARLFDAVTKASCCPCTGPWGFDVLTWLL